jgi:hypothetical protein
MTTCTATERVVVFASSQNNIAAWLSPDAREDRAKEPHHWNTLLAKITEVQPRTSSAHSPTWPPSVSPTALPTTIDKAFVTFTHSSLAAWLGTKTPTQRPTPAPTPTPPPTRIPPFVQWLQYTAKWDQHVAAATTVSPQQLPPLERHPDAQVLPTLTQPQPVPVAEVGHLRATRSSEHPIELPRSTFLSLGSSLLNSPQLGEQLARLNRKPKPSSHISGDVLRSVKIHVVAKRTTRIKRVDPKLATTYAQLRRINSMIRVQRKLTHQKIEELEEMKKKLHLERSV